MRQVSIGAFKVATMIKVSDELLNGNVFNLEAYISKEEERVGRYINKPSKIKAFRNSVKVEPHH